MKVQIPRIVFTKSMAEAVCAEVVNISLALADNGYKIHITKTLTKRTLVV